MKIAFLFPGQGSQSIGMGKDIYDKYKEVKKIYELVKEKTNIDIADITFNGTEEKLAKTQNCQLAVLTMCLGILKILENENIEANICAGLSLGEYTALTYSNAINMQDIIKIVEIRGKIMQENIPDGSWSMAAIIGLVPEKVENICKNLKSGFAVPANYNSPQQVVISGESCSITEAIKLLKEQGAKVIELKTKGPFHTIKLKKAADKLKQELNNYQMKNPNKEIFKNIDGLLYDKNSDIKQILSEHIMKPVKFSDVIQNMLECGVDTFVEIGPGRTLSGFVKKINKNVKTININNVETLKQAIEYLKI